MNTGTDNDIVRQQSFDCAGPVDLNIEAGAGLVEVTLATEQADDQATEQADDQPGARAEPLVYVEVRHAKGRSAMVNGLTGLLNLVGRFGNWEDLPAQAVRETTIEQRGELVEIRAPKSMPLSAVPLHIVVRAPAGSALRLRAGSADAEISGTTADCDVQAGSGNVSLERADGAVRLTVGSGSAHLGTVDGDLSAKAGSGDLEIASVGGVSKLTTGSGDVWIGTVRGSALQAKSGSGDLTIADAESGDLNLTAGSGNIRVGVHAGITVELDLVTGSGRASSELEVNRGPAPEDAGEVIRLRCRTGSGNATVTRATA